PSHAARGTWRRWVCGTPNARRPGSRRSATRTSGRSSTRWALQRLSRRTSSRTSTRNRRRACCGSGPNWSTAAEAEMTQRNVVEAINNALAEEMASDPRVMVLGLDVGKLGGVFRTTSGLVQRFGADRVVDMTIAEVGFIGALLGLAIDV